MALLRRASQSSLSESPLPDDMSAGLSGPDYGWDMGSNSLDLNPLGDDSLDFGLFSTAQAPVQRQPEQAMLSFDANTPVATIQAAIDSAEAGSVIELAEGVYTFDKTLVIDRSDITLKGAGSGKTVITAALSDADAGPALLVQSDRNKIAIGNVAETTAAGGNTLNLTTTAGLTVGDLIHIQRPNTRDFLDSTGNTYIDTTDAPLREAILKVTGISGNAVTLSHDLPYEFDATTTISRIVPTKNVTVEGMTIKSNFGPAAGLNFSNQKFAFSSQNGKVPGTITVRQVTDSTFRDLSLEDNPNHGFFFVTSFGNTVEGLTVRGSFNKGPGGNGYGLYFSESFANTVTGYRGYDTRHGVLFSSGNAEHYNSVMVTDTNRDINFHGSPDADNTVIVTRMIQDYLKIRESWSAVSPGELGVHPRSTIDDNIVKFTELLAYELPDKVYATDLGAKLNTRGGNDTLIGGAGADTLIGGEDEDTLTGGASRDIFPRTFKDGQDVITDFRTGSSGDILRLEGYAWETFKDVRLVQSGKDTVVDLGQDGKVTLKNVVTKALTSANFSLKGGDQGEAINSPKVGYILGSDGDDVFTVGGTFISRGARITAGDGDDIVQSTGTNITAKSAQLPWTGVETWSLAKHTGVTLTLTGQIVDQSDTDRFTLQVNDKAVIKLSTGVIAKGDLIVDSGGKINLVNGRSHDFTLGDRVGGNVTGANGRDFVNGGAKGDMIWGGDNNDVIDGKAGFDVIRGGQGNDRLTGGLGNDTFRFEGEKWGLDVITDFAGGKGKGDVIAVPKDAFESFKDISVDAKQVGLNTVLTLNKLSTITLLNEPLKSLSADDFLFY